MPEDTEKLVDDHRKMVALTGNLSDFQLENLKKWPFVVFNNLSKVTVDYNFTSNNEKDKKDSEERDDLCAGQVTFNFHFSGDHQLSKEELQKRLEHLTLWTKFMFWKDTEVKFQVEGTKWEI